MISLVVFLLVVLVLIALSKSVEATKRIKALERRVRELSSSLSAMREAVSRSEDTRPAGSSVGVEARTAATAESATPTPSKAAEAVPAPLSTSPEMPMTVLSQTEPDLPAAAPPPVVPRRPVVAATGPAAKRAIDWEQFAGTRLFGWIGGLALFLGVAFLLKYSFEQGLISPILRVVGGFALGMGAILGGFRVRRSGYPITAHTLCAVGPAILFVDIYGAYDFYGFIGAGSAFLLMVIVTAGSFWLAVDLDSRYVAVLGLMGGFLTPLLSTGSADPLKLFGYLALLNIGLALIALRKRWGFLVAVSALVTGCFMLGWVAAYFVVSKALTVVILFGILSILFAAFGIVGERWGCSDGSVRFGAACIPFFSILFVWHLFSFPALARSPGLIHPFLFVLNVVFCVLLWFSRRFHPWYLIASGTTFLLLLVWTLEYLTEDGLVWGLAAYLFFGLLHAGFSVVLQRVRPAVDLQSGGHIYPILMLVLVLGMVLNSVRIPSLVWPSLFAIDAIAVAAALAVGITWLSILALALTMGTVWIGFLRLTTASDLHELLLVITIFAAAFFVTGLFLERRDSEQEQGPPSWSSDSFWSDQIANLLRLPVLSALLPLLLLSVACIQIQLPDPSLIFGVGLVLILFLLSLVVVFKLDILVLASLIGSAYLLLSWHGTSFSPEQPLLALAWYVAFLVIFFLFPFAFEKVMLDRPLPWIGAALSGPVYFYLIYVAVSQLLGDALIGLLPAVIAGCYWVGLGRLVDLVPKEDWIKRSEVAFFGGVTLFFVSLILPLQFDKEWLTIGWAIEGVALLWFFTRMPHPGLKKWALGLLLLAFARLALNPAVLYYHSSGEIPILNWYLYAYGAVIACLVVGARLWPSGAQGLLGKQVPSLLRGLATVLSFILMNIEIADFFRVGNTLMFQLGESFAQDMTYSLAWALFGFVLLIVSIKVQSLVGRRVSLGLLGVTILKLFLHDVWALGQLYRVAAFVGLACVLILVSYLYQRYLFPEKAAVSGPLPSDGGLGADQSGSD